MRRTPIRIRVFLIGTVFVLVLAPTLAGGAAWLIERNRQQAGIQQRLDTAVGYLTSQGIGIRRGAAVRGYARLLDRLDLLSQLTLITTRPPGKDPLYMSPALQQTREGKTRGPGAAAALVPSASWIQDRRRLIAAGTAKSPATLVTDLYHRPTSRAAQALAALVTGITVLLAGLVAAVWLTGRWMVAPLAGLSAQVDKVAGGDLRIAVPRSRIGEIANIAQAVEGMTAALGETAQRQAEADQARRFLVTSIAHDLRTPLFALRGHLQAIRSGVGDPVVHRERAEARADALERLIGNLFAYTRDDYAEPALRLEDVPVADLLHEVTAGLEQTARLRENTFELEGDRALDVVVDRDRVKRALTNVLDNALRYSPAGAPVHLTWQAADESTVQIAVRDKGPGIDADLLPHVFEPGVRGAPAGGSPDDGAGIGLAIAKRLLEHHGATLTARNHPSGGAVITLALRRADSTAGGPPELLSRSAPPARR
jgi:signal transduction histidine kinase